MTLKALKGEEGALSGRRWDHLAWKIEGGGMTLSMDRCFHRGHFSTKAGTGERNFNNTSRIVVMATEELPV